MTPAATDAAADTILQKRQVHAHRIVYRIHYTTTFVRAEKPHAILNMIAAHLVPAGTDAVHREKSFRALIAPKTAHEKNYGI